MGVRKGAGLEVHHLIEKRYLELLKITNGSDIPAVVLDKIVHSEPANTNSVTQLLNDSARRNIITNVQTLWNHYKRVYGDLGHQDWLDAIWPLFASQGVVR